MSASNYLWGIDLGGTKIEGVIIDRNDFDKIIFRNRIDTEGDKGYKHILSRIKVMVDLMEKETGAQCEILGIGTPGAIDPHTGLLKNSNSTSLNHQPFLEDLINLLEKEVVIANDANCFALAEAKLGSVKDIAPNAEAVFGVIMGTGVGGGIVVNGQVIKGFQGIAGEWGHNFLDASGGPCYCGKSGCIERILSGPSLERYYESVSGSKKKLKNIVADLDTDKYAKETIERLHHFFGLAISNIINILDPEVIVIGGGVGNISSIYTEGVERAKEYTFNTRFDTHIIAPKLGDSAGVFGAALLTL